ncbi:hypothetical protein PV516_19155 [Streptomyces scabiei]|uniref:hypothetical protein n=1 Tax=Streptomyces scabiei TaxID=1930 RepID=UPI0029B7FC93|nr:hypothetical protein [Streptomyces scabiei]MDX3165907.1 hypothetical protein [Streptomyces scabiei]
MAPPDDGLPDNVLPFRRRPAPPPKKGRQCICGAFWNPGFSSSPAWLLSVNGDRLWNSFFGVTHCRGCGRHKLSVIFGRDMRPADNPVDKKDT